MISLKKRRGSWRYKIQLITISTVSLFNLVFPVNVTAQSKKTPIVDYTVVETKQESVVYNPLPKIADRPAKQILNLTVTAYSSTPAETDGDPFTTASGERVRDGIIAANFLPFGTKVRFPEFSGDKIYTVQDRMSSRYWERTDIWLPSHWEARQFGVKYLTMEVL